MPKMTVTLTDLRESNELSSPHKCQSQEVVNGSDAVESHLMGFFVPLQHSLSGSLEVTVYD